ncbi:hypothetical protein H2248_011053 [Termitomyces sp. 'cryptogamus']|nr:hypothetical protein H2248_011053 [Termitomyces sp. 'cryptogamus']
MLIFQTNARSLRGQNINASSFKPGTYQYFFIESNSRRLCYQDVLQSVWLNLSLPVERSHTDHGHASILAYGCVDPLFNFLSSSLAGVETSSRFSYLGLIQTSCLRSLVVIEDPLIFESNVDLEIGTLLLPIILSYLS